jgi:Flp pilus assembly protein TadG
MAVEMALVAPVLGMLLVAIADFSLAYHRVMQMSAALAAGAQYAFTKGQSESGSVLISDVQTFVNTVSAVSLTSVTAKYNNSPDDTNVTSCYCVDGTTPTYTVTPCSATCTDGSGSTAGKFVSVSGTFSYTAVFPFDRAFFTTPFTQTVTVRLQ